MTLANWLQAVLTVITFASVIWATLRVNEMVRRQQNLPETVTAVLERKHLEMLKDLNDGLNTLADRLASSMNENNERLRGTVSQDLKQTRDAMLVLQLSQTEELSTHRETMTQRLLGLTADMQMKHDDLRAELLSRVLERLGEQGRSNQEMIQTTLQGITTQLSQSIEGLTRTTDARLEQISGKVGERLEEGFKKTNETFANVMARLATIDEAQRKIDGLTTNVVSLQELLGDKRSRGAFGEVQLEALVRNLLPPSAYEFQYSLPSGHRVDCMLLLPEPTGLVAVDAKFPLENYHRMFDTVSAEGDRTAALRQFRADLRKHVNDIADRYIVAGETSDGAVMFVPAEAVFAEIHAHHAEVVDHAMQRHVWIVSPTTLMAVLNTARAVIKDVETRRQVHIIKDELSKLGKEFARFDLRMRKLADHIRQAHQDAEEVRVTSDKISRRFVQIERVELDVPAGHLKVGEVLAAEPNAALLETPADLASAENTGYPLERSG
ncbi:MAG TPA: DNA recombination protein RmuC [Burkholderiales bacterium]|nr:DNA recombination protein RmuC [Burkholderiales bacterium]